MRLAALVQGKGAHEHLIGADLPEGIELVFDRPYGQDGDNLFVAIFEGKGDSLVLARKMADFRDDNIDGDACHLLVDDPSERFCEHLYSRFGRFERTLRSVLRLALCSEQGNFRNSLIKELESQTLEQIHSGWFCSSAFQTAVQNMTSGKNKHFSKEQLEHLITNVENDTAWSRAFPKDEMRIVRERFKDIQARRNDVMHFHRISYRRYIETFRLIERANDELEEYNNRLVRGVAPSVGAPGFAESIIKMLDGIYSQMDYYEHLAEAATELSGLIKLPEESLGKMAEAAGAIEASAFTKLLAENTIANNPGSIETLSRLSSAIVNGDIENSDSEQE